MDNQNSLAAPIDQIRVGILIDILHFVKVKDLEAYEQLRDLAPELRRLTLAECGLGTLSELGEIAQAFEEVDRG